MSYDRVPNVPSEVAMPAVAVDQEFTLVTPPNPTADEFRTTILNRRVEFNISKYVNEGWLFTKYNICQFFGVAILVILVAVALDVAEVFAKGWGFQTREYFHEWNTRSILVTLAFAILRALMFVPFFASGYKAVFNAMRNNTKIVFEDFFSCFKCAVFWRLMGLYLSLSLVWVAGLFFFPLLFVGLYLQLTTVFAVPIIVEQPSVGVRQSIAYSFKIFHRYFCSMLGLLLLLLVLQFVGALCLIVGLFVTLPTAFVAMCYCYHHLIGVNGVAVLVPTAHLEGMPLSAPAPTVVVPVTVVPVASAPAPLVN